MSIKNIVSYSIFFIIFLVFNSIVNAQSRNREIPTLAILQLIDETPYINIGTRKIIEDLLLEKLVNSNHFIIYERNTISFSEEKLSGTKEAMYQAIKEDDFSYLLRMNTNNIALTKNIRNAKIGDYVNQEESSKIGLDYNACYLLYGILKYLGSEENKINYHWGGVNVSKSEHCICAILELKLIQAETGKIIWEREVKGISQNNYFKNNHVAIGSKDFDGEIFYDAINKAAQEAVIDIIQALKEQHII